MSGEFRLSSSRERAGENLIGGEGPNVRQAALTLLATSKNLSPKAGRFLGQLVVSPSPLTSKQLAWLQALLVRAGYPETHPPGCVIETEERRFGQSE